jgi:hypothetical protein
MYRRFGTDCSIFPPPEIYVATFRNSLFQLPAVWNVCSDVSEVCCKFPASEIYVTTFRNVLFHLPGVWNLCIDVSEQPIPTSRCLKFMYRHFGTVCSVFPASKIYIATFRNSLLNFPASEIYVATFESSRRLKCIYRRFGSLFQVPGGWNVRTDISEQSVPSSRCLKFM